jgi:hypothetical protein
MFNFIINFFNKHNETKHNETKHNETTNENFCNIYNEQYRSSYNKLWIKQIRNYYP